MATKYWSIKCSDLEPLSGITCDNMITTKVDSDNMATSLVENIVDSTLNHLIGNHKSAVSENYNYPSPEKVTELLKQRLTRSYLQDKNSYFRE